MNLILTLLLLITLAQAEVPEKSLAGFDASVDVIAPNYEAGPYLIYDCKEMHWTCVRESYFRKCEKKRQGDLASEGLQHSCAPIGLFPTKKSCFQRQLFLVTHDMGTRFCIKDEWKEKEM